MSFNIVDLVKDQISDQLLGQMGNALGTEGSQTTGALAGALPGLLSGLMNSAGSTSGAGALFDAVQQQDDGLLGNMGNLLGGDQASTVADQGSSMLSSILGSGALGQLAGVVANFAGISRGNSSSLMGMLAPIIIGVIKKKVFDGGMNANSMASMLSSQKDNVAAAMPQGFSDQLQSAGFFDSIASSPQGVTPTPAPAATQAPTPSHNNASASSGGGGLMKWLLPLVAVVAVGWFGLNYMNKQSATKAAEQAEMQAQAVAEKAEAAKAEASAAAADAITAAQASMPEGVDLTKISDGLEGVFGSTADALTGITDLESAKSAIPSIEEATTKLGGINDLIARLPDAAKGPLAAVASNGLAAIQPLIDKVIAIPGVGAIVEPVIQPMVDMISGLAG